MPLGQYVKNRHQTLVGQRVTNYPSGPRHLAKLAGWNETPAGVELIIHPAPGVGSSEKLASFSSQVAGVSHTCYGWNSLIPRSRPVVNLERGVAEHALGKLSLSQRVIHVARVFRLV